MYKLINDEIVLRKIDGAAIPRDDQNVDWIAYQQWISEGNQPEPADIEKITVVSLRQAKIALIDAGYFDIVNSYIESMPGIDGVKARVEWNSAGDVRRENELAKMMAKLLNLDNSQLDNLFLQASKIV